MFLPAEESAPEPAPSPPSPSPRHTPGTPGQLHQLHQLHQDKQQRQLLSTVSVAQRRELLEQKIRSLAGTPDNSPRQPKSSPIAAKGGVTRKLQYNGKRENTVCSSPLTYADTPGYRRNISADTRATQSTPRGAEKITPGLTSTGTSSFATTDTTQDSSLLPPARRPSAVASSSTTSALASKSSPSLPSAQDFASTGETVPRLPSIRRLLSYDSLSLGSVLPNSRTPSHSERFSPAYTRIHDTPSHPVVTLPTIRIVSSTDKDKDPGTPRKQADIGLSCGTDNPKRDTLNPHYQSQADAPAPGKENNKPAQSPPLHVDDETPPPIQPKSAARVFQRQDLSGILRLLLPRGAPQAQTLHRPLSFVSLSPSEAAAAGPGAVLPPRVQAESEARSSTQATLRNPSFKHQVRHAQVVTREAFVPEQACTVDFVEEGTHSDKSTETDTARGGPVIYPDHFERQALIEKYRALAEQEQITAKHSSDDATTMADDGEGNVAMPRLEDLLRYPEDLDKISTLKAEYSRKKAAVDSQLREGLRDQLETVQRCMNQLGDGQRHVIKTRDELHDIDKLCAESQNTVGDFSQIDKLARIQRGFEATLAMKEKLESFETDLAEIEQLLKEDDDDLANQPNLLAVHMSITKLRDFRDEAMDQIRRTQDKSAELTLTELFAKLDGVIEWFDEHLGMACMNLIPLVQEENHSMVVRLAVVIMNEEKKDSKVLALQEAQKDHKDLASRFKSMNVGPKTVHGYKEKFLKAIKLYAEAQFEQSKSQFLDDPNSLNKTFRWFFNDLFTVKKGMQSLMPKKWKIFQTYTNIYHQMMHDFLMEFVNDADLPASQMLAIIHWTSKYYAKMAKLGWQQSDLQPNVLDDREGELVRDWRNLIVKSLDEWMDRFNASDRKRFLERDADSLDTNMDNLFCTKTHGDMWRMVYEQIQAAAKSERTDVVEGVIDAMFRSLKNRQVIWQNLIDEEIARYKGVSATEQSEGIQALQDWLIAVANDQIAVIDDGEPGGGGIGKDGTPGTPGLQSLGYLTRFRRDFEPHVSPKFLGSRADAELDSLRDGYVDLSTHCLSAFNELIFTVDFATTLPEFFTPKWYSSFAMKRIMSTFEDYLADYQAVLHPSLAEIMVEELSDELLVRYLSSVRNKGAKFRRQDPWTEKFKDDVLTVFGFFKNYQDSFMSTIKDRWRLVDWLVRLLEADKEGVVMVYEGFKQEYWDLQLSWVEAVLRARDDFERSMASSVKAKAAEMSVERGPETLMSKVR